MFGDKRRLLMSGGVLAVLVVVMWAMQPGSAPSSAAVPAPAGQPAAQNAQSAAVAVPPVKLESLSAERDKPSDTDRNPFRYQPKFVPPPPKPTVVEQPAPTISEPPKPIERPGPPPLAPIPLKFIGLLERANGVKWAV